MLKINFLMKKIAWNGISLKIPTPWEIDSLQADHLIIGKNSSPEIEIKWTDAPGQFTLEKYLKKFIAKSQKLLHIKIHELSTPLSFKHPVKTFEFFFFSWESASSKGNGTLIFCTLCKRLTMIRFFSDSQIISPSLPHSILTSYLDHPMADQADWQLFGLDFSAPKRFKLIEYSFKPGYYTLILKHEKTTLTVFSWGPASFLLSTSGLSEFATQRLPGLKGFATAGHCPRGSYLEWSFRQGRFKNAEILPVFNRYEIFTIFRICHDTHQNRIFGIQVVSPVKFETNLISRSMIGDGE